MTFNLIDTVTPLEKRIQAYLDKEKHNKDKKIVKIADILIDEKMVSAEIIRMHIKYLRKIRSGDNFETLLLAFLLTDLEEYDESISLFREFISHAGDNPIVKEIQHFIILIRISEINDFSNIGQDAVTLIESIGTEDNIVTLLWRFAGIVKANENPELFLKLVNRSIELYPGQFRLFNYKGWIFQEQNLIDQAITEYLKIVEGLAHDPDHEYFNLEMATAYHSLAECSLLLPDPGKAIAYCNLALKHDEMTEENLMESMILLVRAKAYLILNDKTEEDHSRIMADVSKVLEIDPDNAEAQAILQQINDGKTV
jgi:tetratricopeptide (TPR) repeat protein